MTPVAIARDDTGVSNLQGEPGNSIYAQGEAQKHGAPRWTARGCLLTVYLTVTEYLQTKMYQTAGGFG
jgi:hypothetical protein